jgi:glutamyl-tRNA reductase
MTVALIGTSFRTAPIELRERTAVRAAEAPAVLQRICAELPAAEAVLISTCNRTELYLAGANLDECREKAMRILLKAGDEFKPAEMAPLFYVKSGKDVAEHLISVASSLDSMVVGEAEVLGQVKQALTFAEEARTVGKGLHPLFQNAFRAAKRVHTETEICRGRVSVSSLAVEFAEKVFDNLASKTVMLVGAGEMAELALKSLMDHGARNVLILNRSLEHGQALAGKCSGRALQFELLDDYLSRTDIVISSTSAPHIVVRAASVQRAIETRRGRPMLLIDIAVPRDIDPAAAQIKDVYLYTIDDLQRIAAANLAKRQEAVNQAWAIVREELAAMAPLFDDGSLRTLMRSFDEHGRAVCEAQLQRALAKEKLAALPEPCKEEIRALAQKIVARMLAEPREAVKRASRNGDWQTYAKVVHDLFGFDRKDQDTP